MTYNGATSRAPTITSKRGLLYSSPDEIEQSPSGTQNLQKQNVLVKQNLELITTFMTHDMVLDLCGTTTNFEHYDSLYLSLSLNASWGRLLVLCNTLSNKVPFIKLKLIQSKDMMCPCKVLRGISWCIWRALYMHEHPS
jgi:hypothetical protein